MSCDAILVLAREDHILLALYSITFVLPKRNRLFYLVAERSRPDMKAASGCGRRPHYPDSGIDSPG
jgi:hypothetical protein